jgi:hypothetical protein
MKPKTKKSTVKGEKSGIKKQTENFCKFSMLQVTAFNIECQKCN